MNGNPNLHISEYSYFILISLFETAMIIDNHTLDLDDDKQVRFLQRLRAHDFDHYSYRVWLASSD